MGKRNGKRYNEEFRESAVKMVLEKKQSIAQVCQNIGVSRGTMNVGSLLRRTAMMPTKSVLQQLEKETRQLRKEKADLEDTVDILKKAAAIFSQSQRKSTK